MDKQTLLNRYTDEQRIHSELPGWNREAVGSVIRHVSADSGLILYSELTEKDVDIAIDEQIQYFKRLGKPFKWKWFDYDTPGNLKERLKKKGFEGRDPVSLMINPLSTENSLLHKKVSSIIRTISTAKEIDDIISLQNLIWDVDFSGLGNRLKSDKAETPNLLHIYAAYVNDKPVSAAWMYLDAGTSFGSLWGGSTLPEYRGQGIYTDLLAIRAQKAWEMGYTLLTVDATKMSEPILEKRGFQKLGITIPYQSPAD
ncbi:GNAT family N-acetyltransferase [Pseudalkalibacillus decolorationis]|uniref:GNAT family N-acetyltransferase n=1 Tax=Pseudalkalibacillus decolorationis TaxID=163879 RepID=UPI0021476CE5|nr:GNAT family N-acetyltransferase [Pseudalkalibacillus decolorationis]